MSTDVDLRELAVDRGDSGRAAPRNQRRLVTRYVLPLLLILGFLSLVVWASRDVLFPPTPVTVVPVVSDTTEARREGAPLFKAAGWIEPRPTPVRVAALAPGVVERLLVVEDQPVGKDEPVAELVQVDARLAHDRALADLELREAERDEARSDLKAAQTRLEQPVHLRAELGEAEASWARTDTELRNLPFAIRRAEAEARAARKDYEGKSAADGVVAGVVIDIAKSKRDSAEALLEELRRRESSLQKEQAALADRRDALKTRLELLADEIKAKRGAEARVRSAAARVEQARIVVAEAKLRLDRMTVRAPVDGRVYRLIAHPGSRLTADSGLSNGYDGSTVITLYRPDMLQVRVDVRFEDLPKIRLRQPVRVENAALRNPLTGEVLFVGSEADIQKNTLPVKVAIPDPPRVLKPEMLVDVTFLAPRRTEASPEPSRTVRLYVPEQLVHQGDQGPFVWLADQSEGIARKTAVKTGATADNRLVEITGGLTTAGRVISGGTEYLEDGDRIRVTGEDSSIGTGPARQSGPSRTIDRLPGGADN